MTKASLPSIAGLAILLAALGFASQSLVRPDAIGDQDWSSYGGGPGGERYSALAQINRQSVGKLREAWRFDTGEGSLQTSPLAIDGRIYAMTPKQAVIALDAETGRRIWQFGGEAGGTQPVRGLAHWESGADRRLFTSEGSHLLALDMATGRPARSFGSDGRVDLREGFGAASGKLPVYLTSPGVVFGDLIITGFRTGESRPAAPGKVRAFDVRTGALRWSFDLVSPNPDGSRALQDGSEPGGYNNWAGMVLDQRRGIVFVPTGSAVADFYGGDRPGANLYANSLVALDARTGRKLWHFQIVHHDILDRDLPSPPVLLTVAHEGRAVDAVAQTTKQGYVFLFDRVTGKPLFPIEERPVPQSDVPGEMSWPTQPAPLLPMPFARQTLTADDLTTRTPAAAAAARAAFAEMRHEGPFTPLTIGRQTLVFPGFDGGAEWGGPAADPRGILYVNSNEMAWRGALAVRKVSSGSSRSGETLYQDSCSMCHGDDRSGSPPLLPDLRAVGSRLSAGQISSIVKSGAGRMPGFPQFSDSDRLAIAAYLAGGGMPEPAQARVEIGGDDATGKARYRFTGYQKFLDAEGYPAIAPPWGTLSAIDMNSGRFLWQVPLGEYPELAARGMRDTGSENYGGPLVTAGGLVFIGATLFDSKFRAFDSTTGRRVWEAKLPFAGMATPITYSVRGRQFILIAASNGRNPKGSQGSAYVAYALPGSSH